MPPIDVLQCSVTFSPVNSSLFAQETVFKFPGKRLLQRNEAGSEMFVSVSEEERDGMEVFKFTHLKIYEFRHMVLSMLTAVISTTRNIIFQFDAALARAPALARMGGGARLYTKTFIDILP